MSVGHRARWSRRPLLAACLALGTAAFAQGPSASRAGASAPLPGPRNGFEALVGGWSRTDGNYHIVIRSVGVDGALQAMYFNPNPLPFATAKATREGGVVRARFEITAGGYNGSTYELRLDPDTGRLVGTYYQAVARQRYDVEFARR